MLFKVSEELIELSEIFHNKKHTLYIVGGYVRNKLLGVSDYENLDIDLCSSATPLEISKMLKNKDYIVENIDNAFGVVKIYGKDGKFYEHATFRREKYKVAGVHNPTNVEFVDDLEIDVLRRDFRCNAIYYDIYRDEIIDPLDGQNDIKNNIIRTTREPKLVFNDDSERIIRLVRQSCILGFDIDEETYKTAKNNVYKLKYLQKNRLKQEFEKILNADNLYKSLKKVKNKKERGLWLLIDLGVLEYILPMLYKIYKYKYIDDKGIYLINHIINTLNFDNSSSLELKYAILLHDYGKAKALLDNNNFLDYKKYNKVIIEEELGENGLNYNKKFINKVIKIVNNYNIKFKNNWKTRKFIIENYEQIDNIIMLKSYINKDKFNKIKKDTIILIKQRALVDELYPKDEKCLDITIEDIFNYYPSFNKDKISEILNILLFKCIKNYKYNNKTKLIKILRNEIKSNFSYYVGG